jgi:hypothetical protein
MCFVEWMNQATSVKWLYFGVWIVYFEAAGIVSVAKKLHMFVNSESHTLIA